VIFKAMKFEEEEQSEILEHHEEKSKGTVEKVSCSHLNLLDAELLLVTPPN
jgi:hypothetical protein